MPLGHTSYATEVATAVNGAVTTTSRTYNAGVLVLAFYAAADDGGAGAATTFSISNSGTAQTWTQRREVSEDANVQVTVWSTQMSVTQAMTITCSAAVLGTSLEGAVNVVVHTGHNTSDPIPAGKIFSGSSGTDIAQEITPTATGSYLWFWGGDWNATNTFAALANCTVERTSHNAAQQTTVLIRPTTAPRPDAAAFTIGETDTAGLIAWLAFEVQAAGGDVVAAYGNNITARDLALMTPAIGTPALLDVRAWF